MIVCTNGPLKLISNSPSLNHFDSILFFTNDTKLGQTLKQVVTLHDQISLKQPEWK